MQCSSELATETWSDSWGPLNHLLWGHIMSSCRSRKCPEFHEKCAETRQLHYKRHYLVTKLCHLLPFKMNRCYFCSELDCKTSIIFSSSLPVKITWTTIPELLARVPEIFVFQIKHVKISEGEGFSLVALKEWTGRRARLSRCWSLRTNLLWPLCFLRVGLQLEKAAVKG